MVHNYLKVISLSLIIFILNCDYPVNGVADKNDYAKILSVSAICSSDGIMAHIEFDRIFYGRIYSFNYSAVNQCNYYTKNNTNDIYNINKLRSILFKIPINDCGTRISRNTRNVIDLIENKVYIQMDHQSQTPFDRQYSFMCQLTVPEPASKPPEDHPIPIIPSSQHPLNSFLFQQHASNKHEHINKYTNHLPLSNPFETNWGNWPIRSPIPNPNSEQTQKFGDQLMKIVRSIFINQYYY
ncbi:unnamed protein product [Anisakis simplex]|uniref:ZP domain-containing protein n=1 Tax=Anisakis simplex TaxID=6269 RepID=A0A0M3J5G8_ANISI|nr:unnamed protein product [Anisakis simplex]